jgi:hypothetical protein
MLTIEVWLTVFVMLYHSKHEHRCVLEPRQDEGKLAGQAGKQY